MRGARQSLQTRTHAILESHRAAWARAGNGRRLAWLATQSLLGLLNEIKDVLHDFHIQADVARTQRDVQAVAFNLLARVQFDRSPKGDLGDG